MPPESTSSLPLRASTRIRGHAVAVAVLVGAGLGVCAAEDTGPAAPASHAERDMRAQESDQHALATATTGAGARMDALVDEYRFNLIGSDAIYANLGTLASALTTLGAGQDDAAMPSAQSHLAAARLAANHPRDGVSSTASNELGSAASTQSAIIAKLDTLLAQAHASADNADDELAELLKRQIRLKTATGRFADGTMGTDKAGLGAQEMTEEGRLGREQAQLTTDIHQAQLHLRAQVAASAGGADPDDAAATALARMDAFDPVAHSRQAADGISDNRLLGAADDQQAVIDALSAARVALEADDGPSIGDLQQEFDQLGDIAKRQQDNLTAANALDPTSGENAFNTLETGQSAIAGDLGQLGDPLLAQPQADAGTAGKDLGGLDAPGARTAMQATLDGIAKAQSALAGRIAALAGKGPGKGRAGKPHEGFNPDPDGRGHAQVVAVQSGATNDDHGHAAWKVELSPGQRQILSQAQSETFPARYEIALTRYYRALATNPAANPDH